MALELRVACGEMRGSRRAHFAHYRNPSFEGEEVQAVLAKPEAGQKQSEILMVKRDGTEVLRGTASVEAGSIDDGARTAARPS